MPLGFGGFDPQGVWQYGESDTESLMSDLLNVGQESTSEQFELDRARLGSLEAKAARNVALASFVPTLNGYTPGTGTPTAVGWRKVTDGVCQGAIRVKLGTGASVSSLRLVPPIAVHATLTSPYEVLGASMFEDVSASDRYGGWTAFDTNRDIALFRLSQAATYTAASQGLIVPVSNANPFAIAAGDILTAQFTYLVAGAI